MVKYIYKSVILIIAFAGALFFFGHQMETDIDDTGKSVDISEESMPYIKIINQGQTINYLYGYSAQMDANIVRESVTPLAQNKTITLGLEKAATHLIKLQYQIVDKETAEVYDTKTINAIADNQKQVEITFDYNFKTSTEYILDLMGTTNEGREVHYYTRLKYYLDESNLLKKMNFANEFHKNTFNKSKLQDIERNLESSGTNTNSTLASVDITSNSDLVTWGSLSPKIISDEYITIKEYNMETACIQYNYFIQAKTATGKETYHIKEFYRVRYASGHSYLLKFERTMEAAFDPSLASKQSSQFKLGITNETSGRLLTNKDENVLYFSRGGTLYRYDMKKNEITTIFSAFSANASYAYKAYDELGIRSLKVDNDNNMYFCAYGYFPRGRYEGDVAVVLYEYTADGELNELVYMPIRTTYQQLKEDFEQYGYVSSRGIYYFTVANTVYSYNITGKRLEKVAENIKNTTFMTMTNANCYVWSTSLKSSYGESITIYNLETDEKKVIYQPDKDTYIRLLGVIEENVVYGFVRKTDITKTKDGSRIIPCYELDIADTNGTVLKQYKKSGKYIQSIQATGNVVNIKLCQKNGAGIYSPAGEDSILNQSEMVKEKFSYITRVTTKALTEWYIQFPSSFELSDTPKAVEGPKSLMTNERAVRLEQPTVIRYYVYAMGKIVASYEDAGQAIREADKQMGVVVSSEHQVVWERSGSFIQNSIGGLNPVKRTSKVSNLAACAYIVLKQNHVNVDAQELSKKNQTIYDMLSPYLEKPVNLKGCTLEQVLYFVSGNKSVIAMTGNNKAVVIGGYTTTQLYLYDPETGTRRTVSRSQYETVFKNAGKRYISYME